MKDKNEKQVKAFFDNANRFIRKSQISQKAMEQAERELNFEIYRALNAKGLEIVKDELNEFKSDLQRSLETIEKRLKVVEEIQDVNKIEKSHDN